ncbi:phospholipase [Oceanidesulfovibrio marinus]|uniref:Phospholipase n=2 Tax=Oceanidesulfovibrio marinus TaxID=370038 RepID=A0ABX6NIJ4_9BACT|nr:phospholipase [Oceanidesulfovibrio marinus]
MIPPLRLLNLHHHARCIFPLGQSVVIFGAGTFPGDVTPPIHARASNQDSMTRTTRFIATSARTVVPLVSILLAGLLFVLLDVREALAWGPGVHMAIGHALIAGAGNLSSATAALLAQFPGPFLYGCLAADFFVGKGVRYVEGHSHNWATGHAMLREIKQGADPALRAYALGYLAHLAADTVAHNFFVPNLLAIMPMRGTLSHTMLEWEADRRVTWCPRETNSILAAPPAGADASLLRATGRRKLPFLLRKGLMRSGVVLQSPPVGNSVITSVRRAALPPRLAPFCDVMLERSRAAAADVLRQPEDSQVLHIDPIGARNQMAVRRFQPGARINLGTLRKELPDMLDSRSRMLVDPLEAPRFPLDERLVCLPAFSADAA